MTLINARGSRPVF